MYRMQIVECRGRRATVCYDIVSWEDRYGKHLKFSENLTFIRQIVVEVIYKFIELIKVNQLECQENFFDFFLHQIKTI